MQFSVKESIRARRSVRTFDAAPLGAAERAKLEAFLPTIETPFAIPVEFRMLDARVHGLSSPVVVGGDTYVGGKIARCDRAELAFGYAFEVFVLYAQSLGLGTVMIAGTFDRKLFERAMELSGDEMMPMVSPVGYPAKKMSIRETLMRKGIRADDRLPFGQLFFDGSFAHPLTVERAGKLRNALEMVRLAPSAVNRQPWRAVACGDTVHFYKPASRRSGAFDVQKIDLGIALAHFALTLEEEGVSCCFADTDPHLQTDAALEYVISAGIGQ